MKCDIIHFSYIEKWGRRVWPCDNGTDMSRYSTRDVNKVTCKRCLKTKVYKDAAIKSKYPLFQDIQIQFIGKG